MAPRPPRSAARLALLLGAVAQGWAGPAAAEEPVLAAAAGVGYATRASPSDNSVIELNPGALSLNPRYTAAVGFDYYGRLSSKRLTSTAMDSRTGKWALGVAYTLRWFEVPFDPVADMAWRDTGADDPEDKRTYHRVVIATAYGIAQRRINVGISAKILRFQKDLWEDSTHVTLDVGAVFLPAANVAIVVVGNNLVPTHEASDPRTLVSGLAVTLGPVRLEADAVIDFDTPPEGVWVDLNAGGEIRLMSLVALTAGYASDGGFRDSFVTWGAGLELQKFAVRYAMRIEAGAIDTRTRDGVAVGWDRIAHHVAVEIAF